MTKQKHFSNSNRPKIDAVINDGPVLVETSGYRNLKQQVESLLLNGEKLKAVRNAQYDFEAGKPIDESFFDPTRTGEYDLADVTIDLLKLEYNRQQRVLRQKEAENAENANSEGNNNDVKNDTKTGDVKEDGEAPKGAA